MILNKDIYNRVINLIDDPDINELYFSNTVAFQKTLYPFLLNGISIITAPTGVCEALTQTVAPSGTTEILEGNGTAIYSLSMAYIPNSEVVCYINDKVDNGAEYNEANNSVTFSENVPEGEKCSVEFYFAGGFDIDFKILSGRLPANSLESRVVDLLVRATIISWADKQKNFLLDIRNLLTDTDFKFYSPANSLKAKVEWVENLRWEIFNLQNKLDWDLRNQNRSFYGY